MHAKLASSRLDVDALTLEAECRFSRGDRDRLPAGEVGDEVLGDTIGEIFLLAIRRHVDEWQNGYGNLGAFGEVTALCSRSCDQPIPRDAVRQHKPVAPFRRGFQHDTVVILKRVTDFVDALHEAVVGYGESIPQRMNEFVFGGELPGALGQVAQDRKRLRPQRHGMPRSSTQGLAAEIGNHTIDGKLPTLHVHPALCQMTGPGTRTHASTSPRFVRNISQNLGELSLRIGRTGPKGTTIACRKGRSLSLRAYNWVFQRWGGHNRLPLSSEARSLPAWVCQDSGRQYCPRLLSMLSGWCPNDFWLGRNGCLY